MTDPKRLLLEDGSEEERRLLQAGAAEQPPADAAARLALALGLSPPLPPGGTGEGLAKSTSAKLAGTKLALKGALLVGAGAAVALTLTLRSPSRSPSPSPESASTAASPNEPASAPEPPPSQAPSASATDSANPTARSLADEVARLDSARRALAARKPESALSTLDAYHTRHPRGTLAPEALRLRVEVWLAKGDLKRARALAREFLRSYPQSPHAATLRRIAERELNDEATQEP